MGQNSHMDADLARLSRTVDPVAMGQRIRNARLATGMTQSQVAEGLVSPAYVSRIEIGNRRPDTRLLQQLAERLDTTVETLVIGVTRDVLAEASLTLDYAELALKSGDSEEALNQVDGVLGGDGISLVPQITARAQALRAAALEACGRYQEAISHLEALVMDSARDAEWLQALIALSRCYRETGDLARAVEVGARAHEVVGDLGLGGTDAAIKLALTVAAAHFERGDVNYALRLCEQTIQEAETAGSATARSSAYWNASIMRSRQGDVASAVPLAKKAIQILEVEDDARQLARLRGSLAIIQLRLDPPDLEGAESNATAAMQAMEWSDASVVDRTRVRLTLAKVALHSRRLDQARDMAIECLDDVADQAPLLAAEASLVVGRICVAEGHLDQARDAYQRSVHLLTGVGADRKAAQTWFELGGLLQAVGDESAALDAYRRAAVSTGLSASEHVSVPA